MQPIRGVTPSNSKNFLLPATLRVCENVCLRLGLCEFEGFCAQTVRIKVYGPCLPPHYNPNTHKYT